MTDFPVDVLHEDAAIIVVNKPAGMIVHPAPGHETGTLVDWLLARYPAMRGVGSAARSGVVHRLDADTSGVMVFARTERAYRLLREQFENHARVTKTYLAITHGAPKPPRGTLRTRIGRKSWDARRMASFTLTDTLAPRDARVAVTHWEVLGKQGALALVEFRIETGRTHQIRVHAAALGTPIAGDALYGNAAADRRMAQPPKRTLLHAVSLAFDHPITGARVEFSAVPPNDITYAR